MLAAISIPTIESHGCAEVVPNELRERMIRTVVDLRCGMATKVGAVERASDQLGINLETLWTWAIQAEAHDITTRPAGR